jgi:hypothetical protein
VNERRVNRMLRRSRPPVPTPTLVADDARARSLTFEAVPGEPLGPKYPTQLAIADVDGLVDLGRRLAAFRPRRRWFRRLDSARRLERARRAGLLDDADSAALVGLAGRVHRTVRFAHGDLTARNVLRHGRDLWLVDWEWAGLYPPGYELAFLWFSLVDLEDGRARVERSLAGDPAAFLLSALLIQLWHLEWFVPVEYRERHLATRDDLVSRLEGYRSGPSGATSRKMHSPGQSSAASITALTCSGGTSARLSAPPGSFCTPPTGSTT